MHPTLVLNVAGLTPALLGPDTPHLNALAAQGGVRPLATILPAVTCPVQATMLTGLPPRDHGIVANGWYFRHQAEVRFWHQSHHLVAGEKLWETARRRDPSFTCAQLFWWFNMYSSADISVTPRPMYPADGRKLPDVYTQPAELRQELSQHLGPFPLFRFWGPAADITASRWIARCALHVYETRRPTLTLVYLPHLDYNLQRLGPSHPGLGPDLRAVDDLCGQLIRRVKQDGARVMVLSEYGVTQVREPVHINRALRRAGLLRVREELGREMLDPGASQAFAVADHQVAHVYVRSPDRVGEVKALVAALPGVEAVLDGEGQRAAGLDHPRSGELVAVSREDAWFTYYYWLDAARAPDFARTVDIHRKPGYDPAELFLNSRLKAPKLAIAARLLRSRLGFRSLMDVIGLDATLVRGSHGRVNNRPEAGPLVMSTQPELLPEGPVPAAGVKELVLRHLFE